MKKLALCKACNKPLIWKQPYKKGDRPVEKDGSTHNCPMWKGKNEEKITSYGKKYEYERCPYCKGSNYGYCRKGTNDMEVHVKAYHPNGEIRYDKDFSMDKL